MTFPAGPSPQSNLEGEGQVTAVVRRTFELIGEEGEGERDEMVASDGVREVAAHSQGRLPAGRPKNLAPLWTSARSQGWSLFDGGAARRGEMLGSLASD